MPEFKTEDLTKLVQDAFYITVGLGVLAYQRVQAGREDLRKQVRSQLSDAREQLEKAGKTLEERRKAVEERLGAAPGQLRGLVNRSAA